METMRSAKAANLEKKGTAMGKQILLINDLPGYGKVALAAMLPILSQMGHHVFNLPTALVSNTLDYGKFDILETTDYLSNTIRVWDELGFSFDAVSTGFIVSERQAQLVADYCQTCKEKGTVVFVDPIMGDEGKLYNGITEKTVGHMRKLIAASDYMVPNYTEAVYLAGEEYRPQGVSKEQAKVLVEKLRSQGAGSVVITSAKVEGQDTVIVCERNSDTLDFLPFEMLPVRFPGTGDIFSALFMGRILSGVSLVESTQCAMDITKKLIELSRHLPDKYKGIPIEGFLEVLKF